MRRSSFCFLLLCSISFIAAQDVDLANLQAPTDGSTVITSDELHFDQGNHVALFTGNVIVVGTNFKMHSLEMTVYFDNANKVDHVISKGDVLIEQPSRTTRAGQAEFYQAEDRILLTDQPSVLDGKNLIEAPKITIFRSKQTLITEGRTKTTLPPGSGLDTTTSTNAAPSH